MNWPPRHHVIIDGFLLLRKTYALPILPPKMYDLGCQLMQHRPLAFIEIQAIAGAGLGHQYQWRQGKRMVLRRTLASGGFVKAAPPHPDTA